jgi:hypothetical protein
MKPEEVNLEINRVSDHLELQFHQHGDPHILPINPTATVGQIILNPALAARQAGKGLSNVVTGVRDWSNRDRFLIGYGGMAIGRDNFSSYQPGSTSRALVDSSRVETVATVPGAELQESQKDAGGATKTLPVDKVVIPEGVDGPAGRSRIIPRPADPFMPGTRRNSLDLNELRNLQRQGDELPKVKK